MIGYCPNSLNDTSFHPQNKFRVYRNRRKKLHESVHKEEGRDLLNREEEFHRSVEVSEVRDRSVSTRSESSSFVQSVVVVPHSKVEGKYSIYPGVHDMVPGVPKHSKEFDTCRSSFLSSINYEHNISNPELRLSRFEHEQMDLDIRRKSLLGKLRGKGNNPKFDSRVNPSGRSGNNNNNNNQCQCGHAYHSHIFKLPPKRMSKLSVSTSEDQSSGRDKNPEVSASNVKQTIIASIFWKAPISFCEYKHGNALVDFKSLWPSPATVKTLLHDGIEEADLEKALGELCVLLIADGPMSVLQELLNMKYIKVDSQFDDDASLLHLACVLQNTEAVQLLTQAGVSVKLKDKSGKTAGEVCFCSKVRKHLPTKVQSSFVTDRGKNFAILTPESQDKESIFRLASNPKCLYELQKKLQMFDFNVNEETKNEDYLVHIAVKAGICQLPLLLSLVRLQQADMNRCNGDGMTPLMIAALDGDVNLCDSLMCLFGADPNKQNTKNGRTALHYAVMNYQVNVVNCLVKRGADVNIEDQDKCRPDDMVLPGNVTDDCRQILHLHRAKRSQYLSEKIINDIVSRVDLRPTDLSVIDSNDYTLVMVAAINNRVRNLEILLKLSTASIDAQHSKTGLTALAMAAKAGLSACCSVLLNTEACASIPDMQGYLAIHHAVLQNHEQVVDVFREHITAYVGLFKALRLCRKSSIHDKLNDMFDKRQESIVTPQLILSALDGDAGKLFCLLEEGDNVNSKSDLNSQSALFVAVENSHTDVVRLLVEKGADLRKRDMLANTALHIVAQNGNIETAEYLLQYCKKSGTETQSQSFKKLDINAINNDKKTALQIAADKGYINLIRLLIGHGATTALLNRQGSLFTSAEFEGARVLIEGHRNEHTQAIMKLVRDKSKKSYQSLVKIWVPRFDHNLRDKNGDTPLMVACRFGNIETVKFLLQSAVYANQISDADSDHSDADSGVLDVPPWKSHAEWGHEDLTRSLEKDLDNIPLGGSFETMRSLNPSDTRNSLPGPVVTEREASRVRALLTDIERPKGCIILHDGVVSHVCAVNLFDGNTPLHCAIECNDNVDKVLELTAADGVVINVQNDAGLTPVHLACKLGRKKILEKLLMTPGIDLGLLTLNGQMPEEMTTSKSLKKMVKKARADHPPRPEPTSNDSNVEKTYETGDDMRSRKRSLSSVATTINLDKITDIYTSMKQQQSDIHMSVKQQSVEMSKKS